MDELLDNVALKGEMDLFKDYALPLPMTTRGLLPVTYPFVFFVSRAAISIETRRAIRMAGKS